MAVNRSLRQKMAGEKTLSKDQAPSTRDKKNPAERSKNIVECRMRTEGPPPDHSDKFEAVSTLLRKGTKGRKAVEATLNNVRKNLADENAISDAIILALGDGIMIHDRNFRILYQNKVHKDVFGDQEGNYCYSSYNNNQKCNDCHVETSFDDFNITRTERTVPSKNGVEHVEIIATPLIDADGDIMAGIEIVRDITARKRTEDELQELRDHLDFTVKDRTSELRKANKDLRAEIMRRIQMERDLIESQRFVHRITNATPNILYLYDVVENRIIYINPRIKDILGYSSDDIKKMGSGFFDKVLHPNDSRTFECLSERLKNAVDGEIFETEYRMKNSKGDWRWFYSRDVVFKKTGEGLLKLVLGISQDITERKKAEEEVMKSREQLRILLAHLQSVREEERTRISREIHDELGQTLTALKLDLSWIIKRLDKNEKLLYDKTLSMSKLIDMNIMIVKRIAAELRPGLLDNLGLAAALEWQAEEFQKRTGIPCALHITPNDMDLPRELSTAVFRIFQETLTNIARHSRAKNVAVSLKNANGNITLIVRDDGKGISEKQITSPKSIGLVGMKERVNFLKGSLEICGKKNKGTTVAVCIPVNTEKKR